MFYSAADVITRKSFAVESEQQHIVLEKLDRMEAFANAKICRRRILLSYFNEEAHADCGNCDVCTNPPERIDGTILAQKAMSAIIRTNCEIGMHMTIDILRASTKSELTSKGYHLIKTYGVGRDLSHAEWAYYILQMIQLGLLEMDYTRGRKLSVTSYGMDILKGKSRIEFTKYAQRKPVEKVKHEHKRHTPSDSRLVDVLKGIRKQEAQKVGMPAYLVFSDATLYDMAQRQPVTHDEFALVSGVGDKKLERYWRVFVNAIRTFKGMEPFD